MPAGSRRSRQILSLPANRFSILQSMLTMQVRQYSYEIRDVMKTRNHMTPATQKLIVRQFIACFA